MWCSRCGARVPRVVDMTARGWRGVCVECFHALADEVLNTFAPPVESGVFLRRRGACVDTIDGTADTSPGTPISKRRASGGSDQ